MGDIWQVTIRRTLCCFPFLFLHAGFTSEAVGDIAFPMELMVIKMSLLNFKLACKLRFYSLLDDVSLVYLMILLSLCYRLVLFYLLY